MCVRACACVPRQRQRSMVVSVIESSLVGTIIASFASDYIACCLPLDGGES